MAEVAIALPDDLMEFVEQSVRTGGFTEPGQVIVTALYAFKVQAQSEQIKLEALRKDIAVGVRQIEAGESEEWDVDAFLKEINAATAGHP